MSVIKTKRPKNNARASCDINVLPKVMVMNILSFLPLQVGSGSRDAFIGVNRQWFTYVRDIKRPCIEWIGSDDDNKKKGSNAWSLIVSKYPTAINAISLDNLPINAIESLVNITIKHRHITIIITPICIPT
jgi:hypothetical protein